MSSTIMFKCPCCGGYLEFDAAQQRFKCLYCGQVLSEEELRDQSEAQEAAADEQRAAEGAQSRSGAGMKSYHCQMCGAEIITEATTAATRCYYCHSPVILQDRLDDDFRPDGVVPFELSREEAKARFMDYVGRKRFIDRAFFDEGQLEMFSGVYYPYWYFDVDGEASFSGEGTRSSTSYTSDYIVTRTRHFSIRRSAKVHYADIPRKALAKLDGQLSDGIHPFRAEGIRPYAAGYLSGFLAETRDISAGILEPDVAREAEQYTSRLIRQGLSFDSISGDTQMTKTQMKARYILLPVWVLTWKGGKEGAPYYYLMNGQTGKVCGKLPINKKKLWGMALGLGLGLCALLVLGGMLIW